MNAPSRVEAELSMSDFLALAQPGVQKLSPYVPGKPVDELARELGIDPAAIVKLASNENPLGASPKALEAIRAELAELTRYPDGNGFELKRKLAERCAVDAAQVTLGNGSNDILDLVARAYLAPGSERRVQRTCLRRLPDRHPGRGRRGAGGQGARLGA
ncbi:Histidinol-phosphate aminotransferase [Pseudomonas aeruginosa]